MLEWLQNLFSKYFHLFLWKICLFLRLEAHHVLLCLYWVLLWHYYLQSLWLIALHLFDSFGPLQLFIDQWWSDFLESQEHFDIFLNFEIFYRISSLVETLKLIFQILRLMVREHWFRWVIRICNSSGCRNIWRLYIFWLVEIFGILWLFTIYTQLKVGLSGKIRN